MVGALTAAQMGDLVGKMRAQGVLYDGLHVLGGGSILGGLILGAIAVFIIDRNFAKAAGFALAGAVLTFFGFMHGEQIGIGSWMLLPARLPVVLLIPCSFSSDASQAGQDCRSSGSIMAPACSLVLD